jgi:hypothetical protein
MRRLGLLLALLGLCGALPPEAHADARHKRPRPLHAAPPSAADGTVPPPSAAPPPHEPVAAAPGGSAQPAPADAPAAPAADPGDAAKSALSPEHTPKLSLKVDPPNGVKVGQVVHVEIAALAAVGDDVTVAEQSFAPFDVYKKEARVEPPTGAQQRFVFSLELLALEAGDAPLPPIELRVVTKDSNVGKVQTEPWPFKVQSLIANEPNAQPKLETKPVVVLEDNWLPVYVLAGLAAAAAIAGLTLLGARYYRKRKAAAVPPPPPRPPWDIALERLAQLRRDKQKMLDDGEGALFVDQLSDVVRAYLGGRYAFDGLETTTDEMLMQLKSRGASLGFTQEVAQFLGRCDLVKFAKVEPDADEVDLLFAKAQDLVHLSEPERLKQGAPSDPSLAGAISPAPPRRSQRPERPDDGGPAV